VTTRARHLLVAIARGGALLRAVVGGGTRRCAQTAVMFVAVGVAAAGGVLGLTLATSSNLQFQTALAKLRAPDVALTIDASKVTGAELARTSRLPGVTAAAGPYPQTTVVLTIEPVVDVQNSGMALTLVGRASRFGPLNEIAQNYERWPSRDGELELSTSSPSRGPQFSVPGYAWRALTATATSLDGRPKLRIVGYSSSVNPDEDGWVLPGQISALERAGAPAQDQMLYDFRHAATSAQMNSDLAELKAALPTGAIAGSQMVGAVEGERPPASSQETLFIEIFAVLVLLLALLVTVVVAGDAIVPGHSRIGAPEGIDSTSPQALARHLAPLALPALAGAVLGTVLGVVWARPVISDNGGPYHIFVNAPLWIALTVPVAVCVLVAFAGLASLLRAARLTAGRAIADGPASLSAPDDVSQTNGYSSTVMLTMRQRSARLIGGLAHARTTARLRLTTLYGCLFLLCGAALLAITYELVDHAPIRPVSGQPAPTSVVAAQRIADLHDLIVESGIALAVMAVISALLGWLVAGWVLRPLRTITAATREISDTNLHKRLAIKGPQDELRELADTIDALLERLETAFDAQRRFVANASHELRTPLATMRAVLDVAVAKPDVSPQLTTVDANLRQGLDQADRLLESFLALSGAQHGEVGEQAELSLAQLASDALARHSETIASKQIELHTSLAPVRVSGSETLLARMVENVIDNAVRHNQPHGSITIALRRHGERARLVVESGGRVLDQQQVARLVEPFKRLGAERTGSQNGHGLGLSIVAAIAAAHNGSVELQARPEGGLRVQITLPAVTIAQPAPALA
jgi:signal transduction histidine kinase